jgi:hypothetical protein
VRGERGRSSIVSRALVNPVTLAESFHLNDGPAHHLTTHIEICLIQDNIEIMPYPNPPVRKKPAGSVPGPAS